MADALGDRMKEYEARESERRFLPMLPVYARIDGRNFSAFTRSFARPYDKRMSDAMIETTKSLVERTHARIGHTQSDEISLVWLGERYDSDIFFAGRVAKMTSVLASLTTALFMRAMPENADRLPHFDCRVFQLPNATEAANVFLWRELDATKNAISMAARSVFSHRQLDGKSGAEMQEMLHAHAGINFNDYPAFFKRGTFVRRVLEERPFSEAELLAIPEKHRPAPDGVRIRSDVVALEMPRFASVMNREAVIFEGAEPAT